MALIKFDRAIKGTQNYILNLDNFELIRPHLHAASIWFESSSQEQKDVEIIFINEEERNKAFDKLNKILKIIEI